MPSLRSQALRTGWLMDKVYAGPDKNRSQFQTELRPVARHVSLYLVGMLCPSRKIWRIPFFRLASRQQDLPPAAKAAQAEIHTRAQHLPPAFAAGVRFFHDQNVFELYVHTVTVFPLGVSENCQRARTAFFFASPVTFPVFKYTLAKSLPERCVGAYHGVSRHCKGDLL